MALRTICCNDGEFCSASVFENDNTVRGLLAHLNKSPVAMQCVLTTLVSCCLVRSLEVQMAACAVSSRFITFSTLYFMAASAAAGHVVSLLHSRPPRLVVGCQPAPSKTALILCGVASLKEQILALFPTLYIKFQTILPSLKLLCLLCHKNKQMSDALLSSNCSCYFFRSVSDLLTLFLVLQPTVTGPT